MKFNLIKKLLLVSGLMLSITNLGIAQIDLELLNIEPIVHDPDVFNDEKLTEEIRTPHKRFRPMAPPTCKLINVNKAKVSHGSDDLYMADYSVTNMGVKVPFGSKDDAMLFIRLLRDKKAKKACSLSRRSLFFKDVNDRVILGGVKHKSSEFDRTSLSIYQGTPGQNTSRWYDNQPYFMVESNRIDILFSWSKEVVTDAVHWIKHYELSEMWETAPERTYNPPQNFTVLF